MDAMKKILLGIVALVLVVVVGALAYGAHLVGKLNSPEFHEQVRAEVSRTLGAEVHVDEMDIALTSGVTLRGMAIANPPPFEGDLFTAQSFVLKYNLWSLLSGHIEVEQIALNEPSINLVMDEEGRYNYEALGGEEATAGKGASADAVEPASGEAAADAVEPASGDATTGEGAPLEIVLSEVSVSDASVTMFDQGTQTMLMKIDDASFMSSLRVSGNVTQGQAKASIGQVSMADMLFIRDISAPLEMSRESVKLAPLEAKVAGGKATGGVTTHLQDGFRFEMALNLDGVDVKTLLQEAQSAATVAGTLQAETSFEGTGPLPTMTGKGHAEVVDCRIEDSKMMALLSTVMKVPELANPEFEQCRVEFTLAKSVLSTPMVSLKGKALQLTGEGTVNLVSSKIDYDMELALAEELLEKIPTQQLRAAFKKRDDGLSVVAFKVFGTTEAPQTDLMSRIGKAAATEAAKDQVNKLLGRKLF